VCPTHDRELLSKSFLIGCECLLALVKALGHAVSFTSGFETKRFVVFVEIRH